MTQNPFGEGGFDLGSMLQQAQQMQAQLMQAQADLAAQSVTGNAAHVTVTLSGTGELTGVAISGDGFDASDADALTDLGDLVVAAYRDAKAKADALASDALGPLGSMGGDALGGLGQGLGLGG
jgi:DNA-binding YbaB/EbfC family protein